MRQKEPYLASELLNEVTEEIAHFSESEEPWAELLTLMDVLEEKYREMECAEHARRV